MRVTPKPYFLALVATEAETNNPKEELKPGIELLGPIEHIFYSESDVYVPKEDGTKNNLFISKGYDATTHFETTCTDVLDIYKRVTGEDFDFSQVQVNVNLDEPA